MNIWYLNLIEKPRKIMKVTFSVLFVIIFCLGRCKADISGAHGVKYDSWSGVVCYDSNVGTGSGAKIVGNACTLTPSSSNYVPRSGYYSVVLHLYQTMYGSNTYSVESSTAYFDATKPISEQTINVTGNDSDALIFVGSYDMCYALKDETGQEYSLRLTTGSMGCEGDGPDPLPPTPPVTPTSCSINNGNTLNVDLGTVERSTLPTNPGSGVIKHLPVEVNCSGGVDVSVNMQFNYTPVSITGTEIVKSSSNGLGVAIIYNDKPLSSTDVTPVTFISGANTLDLAFEAVRDPAVNINDIPTGSFSASAVLVMTQQ